jgi:hypothetical protein
MEMKIDINLEDVFNDAVSNEESLVENIKERIINLAANDIVYKCRKDCEIMLKSMVQEQMQSIITESFNKWKDEANVLYNGERLKADTYIEKLMTDLAGSMYGQTLRTYMEEFSQRFARDLKKRYDMSFAAMVVRNMAEQKLLRDDKLEELVKQ